MGFILIAVGVVMLDSGGNIKVIVDVGWVFLIGGISLIALTGFSFAKR